ncbi:MAG: MlaE family lipid ABC transporter permease subunit [Gammaproteobacteria bacterium]|nr:MlaE family lipid ABC transporter permease subunit [Gammaproteobacteria bacterium]MDH4316225.1 MlaE family lipid ABC transporter permease subunit [Gammaproteobacteria bacterium]MDH5214085.1 MlaE family lipid ABC transporter permease subunit [Gammaproteobacteria bacterium]
MENRYLIAERDDHSLTVSLKGDWVLHNVPDLETALAEVDAGAATRVTFQCGGLRDIDISGAWVLFRRSREFESEGRETEFQGFKAAHFRFLQNITEVNQPPTVSLINATTTLREDIDTSLAIKVADIVITDDGRGENELSLSGADAEQFEIVGTELRLIAGASLDFETKPMLDVTVEVDDVAIGATPDDIAPLSIAITDVNEPPTVSLTNATTSIRGDANTSDGIKVADIVITDDVLGTNKLILSGTDAALFEIVGPELWLIPGTTLDAASHPKLNVTVEIHDDSLGAAPDDTASLSIRVTETAGSAASAGDKESTVANEQRIRRGLESLGRAATSAMQDVGFITTTVLQGITRPSALAVRETIRQVYQTGVRAIPIVCLISFLMGVVIAYQGATQLAKFGADVFVADLVTISILREMGVIMAAIMVAGRSGSAFAASLGVMKLNEELDALRVMGLNPNQVLVAPRVLGLIIALPLLTGFANLSGLAGGLFLSTAVLNISIVQFVDRAADSADLTTLFVGLVKAPVFAFLIGAVGTLRGLQVTHSAEELGRLTTVAVVQAITLIVAADAVFTFIFVRLGI